MEEKKGTVLIVDDSAPDRALFRTMLERAGYTVFEVDRGSETLAKALEVRPHVIVLDVNLPDLDGLEVCRTLRRDAQTGGIPVLMLTVRHDDRDVLAGLHAGADDYIAKDSAPELVLARVRRLVQYRQLVALAMLNRQLVQVGRLLAGIVHEIRGPLSVIRGSAELLRMGLHSDEGQSPVGRLDSPGNPVAPGQTRALDVHGTHGASSVSVRRPSGFAQRIRRVVHQGIASKWPRHLHSSGNRQAILRPFVPMPAGSSRC